tara:strand:+ start:11076 stop:13313 length:2238 start_codon:yes stop_codon:yes gene_type:complete
MQARPNISYAICVSEETDSFVKLIDFLKIHKSKSDEIVVISDFSKCKKIKNYLHKVDKFIYRKLLDDFSFHKNIFFSLCKNEYIFNLDADEIPSLNLIKKIHELVANRDTDLFWIPRLNFFSGITKKELANQEIKIDNDKHGAINFPDYQGRIYKNDNKLRWKRKLHEQIKGAKTMRKLKYTDDFYLEHRKTKKNYEISKKLYSNLQNYNPSKNSFGVVCCYFNPCNYKSKFLNFVKFLNSIHSTGIYPLVIETYSSKSLYRIDNLTTNIISIDTESLFWKKEQLLNIGIKQLLNKKFEYIAWVDADIIFSDTDWWKRVIFATKFYGVTQIFSHSYKEKVHPLEKEKDSSAYQLTHTDTDRDIKCLLQRKAEPGYGHCYHRSFLEKNLLFDLSIIGGGDILNLIGYYYNENSHDLILNDRFFSQMTNAFKNSFVDWCKKNKKLKHGIGYANVHITTLFHGNKSDRMYVSREHILSKHRYNPNTDLKIKNQIYEIKNLGIKCDIEKYFHNRNEDKHISPTDLELINKIQQTKLNKNIQFIQNEIYSFMVNKNTKNKMSEFIINDHTEMLVAVRETETLFSINRIKMKCKILIDGNVSPCIESFAKIENYGAFGIFLYFICTFYDELPNLVYFAHNNTNKDFHSEFFRKSTSPVNGFCAIIGKVTSLNINQHSKIKNYKSPRIWYNETANMPYNQKYKTFIGCCFSLSKNTIYKKPLSFYANLLKSYTRNPKNEEYMLRFAFYSLFQ